MKCLKIKYVFKYFAMASILLSASMITEACSQATEHPNIIYIMMDDAGYADIGVYGNTEISTPTMDGFAAEGMRFSQYYTSTVCAPSRTSILTGLYPQELGIRRASASKIRGTPVDVVLLPEIFKEKGYKTAHIGKWNLGKVKEEYWGINHGFDLTVLQFQPEGEPKKFWNPGVHINHNSEEPILHTGNLTEILTDYAIEFIEENALRINRGIDTSPFYLNLSYNAPHSPNQPPHDWYDRYSHLSEAQRKYAAVISHLDVQIGRVLEVLDNEGLAQNTMVVITSDNGGTGRNHVSNGDLRGFKEDQYEGGIRVPLMIRWPGHVQANTQNNSVIRCFDFFPTIAEILEVDDLRLSRLHLEGKSFLNILKTGIHQERDGFLFWETKYRSESFFSPSGQLNNFAVRKGGWKLIFDDLDTNSSPYLFNLTHDFQETNDVADVNPDLVNELLNEYWEWRKRVGVIRYAYDADKSILNDIPLKGFLHDTDDILFNEPGRVTLMRDARFDFGPTDFSLTARIKRNTGDGSGASTIAKKEGSWELQINSESKLELVVVDTNSRSFSLVSAKVIEPEIGYDIAVTVYGFRNSNSIIRLYVNSQLEVESEDVIEVQSNDNNVHVGNDDSFAKPFLGAIERLQFWVSSLAENELAGTSSSGGVVPSRMVRKLRRPEMRVSADRSGSLRELLPGSQESSVPPIRAIDER